MKIFPMKDESSARLAGFEFKHAYISLSNIRRLLMLKPEVSEVTVNASIDPPGGIRASFLLRGQKCKIVESFGDSSYYHVSCDVDEHCIDATEELADIFQSYRPTILERVIGGIFTLEFMRIFSFRNRL